MTPYDRLDPDEGGSPVESFLAQPPLHADEDVPRVRAASREKPDPQTSTWQRIRGRVNGFMFEKQPGQSSSSAPRTSDGRRTKIFPFNGNGRGR